MNAFKRYCKAKFDIVPESEYPYLPFPVTSSGIVLESIRVDAERATITTVYNVLVDVSRVTRKGQIESIDVDDGNPKF